MILKDYSPVNKVTKGRTPKLNLAQLLTLSRYRSCLSVIVCMPSFGKHWSLFFKDTGAVNQGIEEYM